GGRPFALALLDRAMPGMDGMDLATTVSADPAIPTRLVLMTGLGQEPDPADAELAGVCSTLTKPVHEDVLRTHVRAALQLSEVQGPGKEILVQRHPSSDQGRAGRLLLAEDNVINQKVALAMLSGAGYSVDAVCNGAEAVAAVATRSYDLILMDCQMPELNGYEATAAIRAHEGSGRHTPIIAMTAGARGEDRERCLAEGMDNYLAKPVKKDALLALVGQLMPGGTS
ncbi:MAG: two-component system, sensor histidine kinase and response regulator, partial [Actinomycetota bacterium]|nr:two-component system, sensor histidine kinase and response regulator [Actinomycetota bacterium]